MPAQRGGSFDDLFNAVRALFAAQYHGWVPHQITILAMAPQPNDRPVEKHFELPMPAVPPPDLTSLEGDILDALADEWMTGKQIASQVGKAYSGYLKTVLAQMVEKRLLEQGPQGYHERT